MGFPMIPFWVIKLNYTPTLQCFVWNAGCSSLKYCMFICIYVTCDTQKACMTVAACLQILCQPTSSKTYCKLTPLIETRLGVQHPWKRAWQRLLLAGTLLENSFRPISSEMNPFPTLYPKAISLKTILVKSKKFQPQKKPELFSINILSSFFIVQLWCISLPAAFPLGCWLKFISKLAALQNQDTNLTLHTQLA